VGGADDTKVLSNVTLFDFVEKPQKQKKKKKNKKNGNDEARGEDFFDFRPPSNPQNSDLLSTIPLAPGSEVWH
jgi:hypothetical protein